MEELVDSNPVEGAERPKPKRRRWRILEPVEIGRVLRAFEDEQARMIFLTLMLTGLRRFELQGLRWRDVDLVESVLRVDVSKTEEGERSIALSPALVEALMERLRVTAFAGDDEFVFCHPTRARRSTMSGTRSSSGRRSPRPGSPITFGRSTTSGTAR